MAKSKTTDLMLSEYRKFWQNDDGTNKVTPPSKIFFSYPEKQNHEEACYLFRFFFEDGMHWTPEEAMNYLNKEIVDEMRLNTAYNKLIFPKDLVDKRSNYWYVAVLCYPSYFKGFTEQNQWIMEYNQIRSTNNKLSKKIFTGIDGRKKAALFLNTYYLSAEGIRAEFTDLEAMYLYFASDKGKKYIQSAKLEAPLKLFFMSPLDYFHESLPNDNLSEVKRSEFLYLYADFMTKTGQNPFDSKKKKN